MLIRHPKVAGKARNALLKYHKLALADIAVGGTHTGGGDHSIELPDSGLQKLPKVFPTIKNEPNTNKLIAEICVFVKGSKDLKSLYFQNALPDVAFSTLFLFEALNVDPAPLHGTYGQATIDEDLVGKVLNSAVT